MPNDHSAWDNVSRKFYGAYDAEGDLIHQLRRNKLDQHQQPGMRGGAYLNLVDRVCVQCYWR